MEKNTLDSLSVNKDNFRKRSKKVLGNLKISGFYKNMAAEGLVPDSKAFNVSGCFKFFDIDHYRFSSIKDIKRVSLCKDKFCINCQNHLSLQRAEKFTPELLKLSESYALYHVVFTVPNCSPALLKSTLNQMYNRFAYLLRYFRLDKKVKGLDFSQFGYAGAVRSLEVVISPAGFAQYEFHPHFHCFFVLDKKYKMTGSHINKFSFYRSELKRDLRGKRFFTDFEILLQKLWYLVYNGIKVTNEVIDSLDLGYSVYCERTYKDFKEVFKYSVKGLFDPRSSEFEYSEDIFRSLYFALNRRKIIQGYGILNRFSFDEDDSLDQLDDQYNKFIEYLNSIEKPVSGFSSIDDLLSEFENFKHITYISKKSMRYKKL